MKNFSVKHMKVVIVGVFHNEQSDKRDADTPELRSAKDALEELIRSVVESRGIRFIGEEAKGGIDTIAKRIAEQSDAKIPWVNIDMTDEEERRQGIHDGLQARPFDTDFDDNGRLVRKYYRIPEDETRESFFVEKTKKEAANAGTVLVICGHCHVEALQQKFTVTGCHAEVVGCQ
jgi:hypothetical protein